MKESIQTHNMKVFVSIIVPVYNVASYLSTCLDSLVGQTLKEIEIILINDASTDSSGNICDAFAAKDARIRVIHHTKNIRQGKTRNEGIEIARGEYISFADPDDWVDLDFYEKLYTEARLYDVEVVKAGLKKTSEEGVITGTSDLNKKIQKGIFKKEPLFLLFNYEHVTAIYAREYLLSKNIRYPDIQNGEDDIFLLQVCYFTSRIRLIDNTFYYYRGRTNSLSTKKDQNYYTNLLLFFDLYLDFLHRQHLKEQEYHKALEYSIGLVRYWFEDLNNRFPQQNHAFKKYFLKRIFEKFLDYPFDQKYLLELFFPKRGIRAQLISILKLLYRKLYFKVS